MGDDYISVEEAARRSGLHENTVRRLLRSGEITGYKDSWRWLVSVRSLRHYTNPVNGFLLELPGPKLFLTRRDERARQDEDDEG